MRSETFVWDVVDLDARDSRRFGGKATGLARMVAAGIPVPPAFVVSTDAFRAFAEGGRRLPDGLQGQVEQAVAALGEKLGRRFGGGAGAQPLLVSVRSGAQVSMPGMMDTVLNLGLDAAAAEWLIAQGGDKRFVIDTWLRFWKMYSEIVLGLDGEEFAEALAVPRSQAESGTLALAALERVVVGWLEEQGAGSMATAPQAQLQEAIAAVFRSWDSPRAKAYREHHGIPHDLGTAVTVQAMVFGNADARSGSGVAFSRNPNDGDPALYGEYLVGRQGEDIVSGAATPVDLSQDQADYEDLRGRLADYAGVLEELYGDAVDIEFTVEAGMLYLLQVRPAKRTAEAAVRIAADLVEQDLIDQDTAMRRVSTDQVRKLLRPVFDPNQLADAVPIARGIGSSPGQTSGVAVLDSDRAAERASAGERVVLLRPTTSPLDIRGMLAAEGVLTARGGALSHAAVVSRALDKPCVVGCEALSIDPEARTFGCNGHIWHEGDAISIDGASGDVYVQAIALTAPEQASDGLERLLGAADVMSGAQVWAQGIGCTAAPGLGVVSLTDIAVSQGRLHEMVESVRGVGRGVVAAAGLRLAAVAAALATPALAAAAGRPLHVRIPVVASARARVLLPDWEEFDQHLFLPMGNPAYSRAWLDGLQQAAVASGTMLTPLLGGVIDVGEWRMFRDQASGLGMLQPGVLVQHVAGLEQASAMLAEGAQVWLDMDELIHSAFGSVSVPNVAGAVLDEYVAQGALAARPDARLRPFLRTLVQAVVATEGSTDALGVALGAQVLPELAAELLHLGIRRFSVPPEQRDMMRLILGQQASAVA